MIYHINNDHLKKVKEILNTEGKFVGRFRKENGKGFVEVYNFTPSAIVLYENKIEITSRLEVSGLYSKAQLEEKAEIKLEEIEKNE